MYEANKNMLNFTVGNTWLPSQANKIVPVAAIVFLLAAAIACVMVFTSKYELPPSYYKTYSSYVGFVVGVAWIYLICNEVVSVIRVSLPLRRI